MLFGIIYIHQDIIIYQKKNKEIDYDYILNNLEEFEKNDIFSNLFTIFNEKIYKITLLMNIKKNFIKFLNN